MSEKRLVGTRGPGVDSDHVVIALLLNPQGKRRGFIGDRLPDEEAIDKCAFYVTHVLGAEQGYVAAPVDLPMFTFRSKGAGFVDEVYDRIEPWLDEGEDPSRELMKMLAPQGGRSLILSLPEGDSLNWRQLTKEGFKAAYRNRAKRDVGGGGGGFG
jgi:hypothetical protein